MKRKIFLAKKMQFNSLFALRSTVRPPGPDKGELYRIADLFTHSIYMQVQNRKWKSIRTLYMYRTFFERQKRRRLTQNFSLHRIVITPSVIVFKNLKFLYRTMPINLKSILGLLFARYDHARRAFCPGDHALLITASTIRKK